MQEELQRLVEDVLQPLLEREHSGLELVEVQPTRVHFRISGSAASGAGAEYIQCEIVERAVRKVVGEGVTIHLEKVFAQPGKAMR